MNRHRKPYRFLREKEMSEEKEEKTMNNNMNELTLEEMDMINGGKWNWRQSVMGGVLGGLTGAAIGALAGGLPGAAIGGVCGITCGVITGIKD